MESCSVIHSFIKNINHIKINFIKIFLKFSEEQAIERCHRIGQKKEVFVTRFICEDSIESRMIKLHEEKRDLFENTIQTSKKDKKEQNIEHFKYLMSTY